MPRLILTFGQFIDIITAHGFVLHRHGATSHRRYRAEIDGKVYFVDVAGHRASDTILPKTLASMIRQSGLPKRVFER